jgi:3',5'-cyclic AMP phosphodiesterase CpdA
MGLPILHISDIHPRPGDNVRRLAESIAVATDTFRIGFLVASGDLGYQGQNQRAAAQWLGDLADKILVPRERIICIPGNHDIDKGRLERLEDAFGGYSQALFQLLKSSERAQVKNASRYIYDDHEFLLVNSAYHLDTTFGMVDCDGIRGLLRDRRPNVTTRVAVVHHNPISVEKSDRSTIANAYEFLRIVSDAGYDVLLHGHQHIAMALRVGEKTRLAGVGSVNFEPGRNINNQFNIVEVGGRVVRFRFHADSTSTSGMGNWDSAEEPW